MIDIVIPLKSSDYGDVELKYCLRSIDKYLTGYRDIYIIGDKPKFDGQYIHIPCDDPGYMKEKNIRRKIMAACADERISSDFFFTNDDHIYLQPLDVRTLPYYYSGNLELAYRRKRKVGSYKAAIDNTRIALETNSYATYYFDIHAPIMYNKQKFLWAMDQYDWGKPKLEYVIKSLYCNTLCISGTPYSDMMIGYPPTDTGQIYNSIAGRFMFAFNETALTDPDGTLDTINPSMLAVLEELTAPAVKVPG